MNNNDKLLHFLLESKGISDICFEYRDFIKKDINDIYASFISSKNFSEQKVFEKRLVKTYNFDDDRFKINNLTVRFNLFKYSENVCNSILDIKNSTVDLNKYINDVILQLDIFINDNSKDFLFKINSIIVHELVHIFEHYNLLLGDKFRPKDWSIGSMYPQLRHKYKNVDVQNILHLLYISLRNEISSQLHQYYDYKKNDKDYDHIYNIIEELKNFKVVNINDNFIKEMNKVRQHIYKSIKFYTINKNYLKDLDKSIWSQTINFDNINDFINDLKSLFEYAIFYIEKKIRLVNRKLNEIVYDDYKGLLTESVFIDNYIKKYPVLFF